MTAPDTAEEGRLNLPGLGSEDGSSRICSGATPSALPQGAEGQPGWQPIETAPRDGTDVLLFAPVREYQGQPVDERTTVGHWTTEEECRVYAGDCGGECRCPEFDYIDASWISWDGGFLAELPPTHWMPLPEPPAAAPQPRTETGGTNTSGRNQ